MLVEVARPVKEPTRLAVELRAVETVGRERAAEGASAAPAAYLNLAIQRTRCARAADLDR